MHERAPAAHTYAAIGVIACSMLIHEILLTRICALRLYFHFAFLVISNCLLGLGASGALLVAFQARLRSDPRRWLGRAALAYTASLIATFAFLRQCPLPEDLLLSNPVHLLALSAFNVAGAVPFVFGGLCVGMLLAFTRVHVNRLYAVDLAGAALGCIACPLLLPLVGAAGVFVVTVLLGVIACAAIESDRRPARVWTAAALLCAAGVVLLPRVDAQLPIPSRPLDETLRRSWDSSRYGGDYRVWTSNSRIDLLRMPPRSRPVIFMLGRIPQLPVNPEWAAILQDANAGTSIVDFSEHPEALDVLQHSMYSASYRLKPRAKVLVIGLGGGNDVWAAKINGALSVKAIELNGPIVDLHKRLLRRYSQDLAADPSVALVVDEGRSALMRETQKYDVIQMSGIDTWTALASGAYVLAENYLYTREAIVSMLKRLQPGGIVQIARFAATMEGLRLLSNMAAALGSLGWDQDFARSVIALATPDKMMAVLLKPDGFSDAEQSRVAQFARDNAIELVYLPRRPAPGILDRFVRARDRDRIIAEFPTNLAPTDDDRPYFFNYARWQHPIESLRHFHDLPAASQGNPWFVLLQLALSLVLSAMIIVWPTARHVQLAVPGRWHQLVYFGGLGLGFIFVELAVIQKLTLLLGQPMYSLTVTLCALLVFTGLGSYVLGARFPARGGRVWFVPLLLAGYLVVFALGAPSFVEHCIALPLGARIAITAGVLAPLGVLLGMPFAHGLRVLHVESPALAPWAWAINGCASVVGSILTVIVSMNFGFAVVLYCAAAAYLTAFAVHARRPSA
jgi:spermidine synthase